LFVSLARPSDGGRARSKLKKTALKKSAIQPTVKASKNLFLFNNEFLARFFNIFNNKKFLLALVNLLRKLFEANSI